MPEPLQHRMLNLSVEPPAEVWERISRQLDAEYHAADHRISVHMEEAAISPPPAAWEAIQKVISADSVTPARTRRLNPRTRIVAAAAITIGTLLTAWFLVYDPQRETTSDMAGIQFLIRPGEPDLPGKGRPLTGVAPAQSSREALSARTPDPSQTRRISASPAAGRRSAQPSRDDRNYANYAHSTGGRPAPYDPYRPIRMQAGVRSPEPVLELPEVQVAAPPLRDGQGRIILDRQLISRPGDLYVTITGPNGDPARISVRFLDCLISLNSALSENPGEPCDLDVHAWREMLSEAAFLPDMHNFFDIFALKELSEEE